MKHELGYELTERIHDRFMKFLCDNDVLPNEHEIDVRGYAIITLNETDEVLTKVTKYYNELVTERYFEVPDKDYELFDSCCKELKILPRHKGFDQKSKIWWLVYEKRDMVEGILASIKVFNEILKRNGDKIFGLRCQIKDMQQSFGLTAVADLEIKPNLSSECSDQVVYWAHQYGSGFLSLEQYMFRMELKEDTFLNVTYANGDVYIHERHVVKVIGDCEEDKIGFLQNGDRYVLRVPGLKE